MRVRRLVPGRGAGPTLADLIPPAATTPAALPAVPGAGAVEVPFVSDNAFYYGGKRIASPPTLTDTYALLDRGLGMAWIDLLRPSSAQFATIAARFALDDLAAEDAVQAHQRPKLERYDDMLFVALRPARYDDAAEEVLFGEVHALVGTNWVVTVRHGEAPALDAVRGRLESDSALLALGPEAVVYAILDGVVDGYEPVVRGLEKDIDEIEVEVFRGDPGVSMRIYELSREVIEFQRAAKPLSGVVANFSAGAHRHEELQNYLRDVQDHVLQVVERLEEMRQLLQNILATNAILVQQQQNAEMKALTEASYDQNEEIKKVSAWAAILFAPTLIGTVYGMNFDAIPELHWAFGYPFALALMAVVCVVLYVVFRKRGWL